LIRVKKIIMKKLESFWFWVHIWLIKPINTYPKLILLDVDDYVEMTVLNEGQMGSLFGSPSAVYTVVKNNGTLIETSVKMQIHIVVMESRSLLKVDRESLMVWEPG
jgi:hypothetical protein